MSCPNHFHCLPRNSQIIYVYAGLCLLSYSAPWRATIHSGWMTPLLTRLVTKFCHLPHFHGYLSKAGISASLLFLKLQTQQMQNKEYVGLQGFPVTSLSLALNPSWLCPSLTLVSTSGGQKPPYPDPLFFQSCLKVISYQHSFYLVRAGQQWHRHSSCGINRGLMGHTLGFLYLAISTSSCPSPGARSGKH